VNFFKEEEMGAGLIEGFCPHCLWEELKEKSDPGKVALM